MLDNYLWILDNRRELEKERDTRREIMRIGIGNDHSALELKAEIIEFLKEKGDLLNAYKEGDKVKVSINIGGREWTSPQGEVRYFNSITGWRIEKVDGGNFNEPVEARPAESKPAASNTDVFAEEDDDLPF